MKCEAKEQAATRDVHKTEKCNKLEHILIDFVFFLKKNRHFVTSCKTNKRHIVCLKSHITEMLVYMLVTALILSWCFSIY